MNVAGFLLRVVTVTYDRTYLRDASHARARSVAERPPGQMEGDGSAIPERRRGWSAGPCGSAASVTREGVWTRLLVELALYQERYGQNPLGERRQQGAFTSSQGHRWQRRPLGTG